MPKGELRPALAAYLDSDAASHGLTEMRAYGTAVVTAHRVDALTWSWASRPDDRPLTAVLFATAGGVAVDGAGSGRSAGILLHSTHSATVRWSPESRATAVWLGTESVVDDGVPPALHPVTLPGTALTTGLRAFAETLVGEPPAQTGVSDHVIERLLVEMVHGVLLEQQATDAAPYRAIRPMHRARMLMVLNRSDPAYGPETLAQELHMSPRHLQRLFAREGSSPAAELRKMRAELALSLLRDPQYDALTAAEIASHSGFTNTAALRRALRVLGAPTPQAARARRPPG